MILYIMAEIAIPIVALGGMYVISNNKKNENFTNMGKPKNYLTNVNPPIPAINYPTTSKVSNSNVNKYSNPHQATDKYYSQNIYEKIERNNPPNSVGGYTGDIQSLKGGNINVQDFKHNNMVPFFGAKIKGNTTSADFAETQLDNMQGNGSQLIRKKEIAPLFQPHSNLQYANGAPNRSDFLQSRVNPGMKMSNITPWEQQKVAPGLGKGFSNEPEKPGPEIGFGAGFNTGMEDRNAWLPKGVNELRVDTNPKMTYGLKGHEGPANAYIKDYSNVKQQGRVEKYAPDTYYDVGPSRWFTSTGMEKAQTARGVEILQDQNRRTTNKEYFGNSVQTEGSATYTESAYTDPKRPQLPPNQISHASATHIGAGPANNTYDITNNNRSSQSNTDYLGPVQGMFKSIVAPILDVLRPTRKENVIGNIRADGNVQNNVSALPVYNPADRTKTTIRETTKNISHLNVDNQIGGNGYLVNEQQSVENQRDTTNCPYTGNGNMNSAPTTYDAAYNQRNNVNKTSVNRPNMGGTQLFNNYENISINKKQSDINNSWTPAPSSSIGAIPSTDTYGKINTPQYYNECIGCDRINPDILTAFKNNPYTQSLNSWA